MTRLEKWLNFHVVLINSRPLDPSRNRPPILEGDQVLIYKPIEMLGYVSEQLQISESFLRERAETADVCVCYLRDSSLLAYVWLGFDRIPMEASLFVTVQKPYVYSYKAFTHPSHRGKQLQNRLGELNDTWLTARGYKFNIDYIKTHNYASLVADRRYGNKAVAYLAFWKIGDRTLVLHTSGLSSQQMSVIRPSIDSH
ncbi:MAG: hypothetical protein GKR90_06175 [Pseudomonadales bacterium]|nr:hypothetical protein [Pseudomonadales bacterium]